MAARFIVGVAVLLNLILVVLLIQQVSSVRSEIAQLSDRLASKQDVAMLRPIRVRQILNERCSSCHTERRFAATLEKGPGGSAALVKRMQAHQGADIPDDELAQIESALLVFRCTACHGEGVINRVILMPTSERTRFMRQKVRMAGSPFRTDQVGELLEAFQTLADGRS